MKTMWVVYTDSNPVEVRAFFSTQEQAVAWRDNNFPTADVKEARLESYDLLNVTVVTF